MITLRNDGAIWPTTGKQAAAGPSSLDRMADQPVHSL